MENAKRFDTCRLFEIGYEIHKRPPVEGRSVLPDEVPHLMAAIYAKDGDGAASLYELKRLAECILPGAEVAQVTALGHEHPVRSAALIWRECRLGRLFELHPSLVETGRVAVLDIDLGAVLGMLTVILVMSYGQTRIIFAMSRDGLLPAPLSRVHPRFATPFLTTWLVGLFFGLIGALVPLNVLAELINIGTLAAFSMVSIAVLVLRRTHPHLPRAFRCPGVPVVPILAVASCLFLMVNLAALTWIAFVVWVGIGIVIYFAYSRHHSRLAHAPHGKH
jgi:hypothetical protein